ncbi:unnamed protein product [Chilo suppressalis]|uniref:Uncharacterized protein n=1 Tax=Chilo suppressalis TaxID=168631 RepID=A0ABN8E9S7_CHISP|nr:unnamed protein product [Chilo suppressalis]
MCYIFNCFGWTLDLIQRFITFFLACWLAYAVGLGLAVALTAGIAYGYNYSLAEFLTFTRSDVTVYMRRGQFYDRPDSARGFRRAADEESEQQEVTSNEGIDYQELRKDSEDKKPAPLGDSWQKAQDTRKYAERLIKYEHKPMRRIEMSDQAVQAQEFTEPETMSTTISSMELAPAYYMPSTSMLTPLIYKVTTVISITPNLLLPTALFQSGSSQIVMRNFKPVEVIENTPRTTPVAEQNAYGDSDKVGNMDLIESPDNYEPSHFKNLALPISQYVQRARPTISQLSSESKDANEDVKSPTPTTGIPMRRWQEGTLGRPADYPIEEFYLT